MGGGGGARVEVDVVAGPLAGQTFVFDSFDTFLFGRDPECHAHLPEADPLVSRFHFALEVNPPSVGLRDLGSLNGTLLNGVKAGGRDLAESAAEGRKARREALPLKDGDRIAAGATHFVVRVKGAPVAAVVAAETVLAPKPAAVIAETVLAPLPERTAQPGPGDAWYAPPPLVGDGKGYPTIVGEYRIHRHLGGGGMGDVFLAHSAVDGRPVAVKFLNDRRPAFIDRFVREAALQESLGAHPNIVQALGSGRVDDTYYLVVEYCPGGSLDDRIFEKGTDRPLPMPYAEALPLFSTTLEGMARAHAVGVIHRDIKPANVLLASPTIAKIADLGLAKCYLDAGGLTTSTKMTGGTPEYMPNEQWINFKRVLPTADVFALGVMFFQMLTGRFPREAPMKPCRSLRGENVVPANVADVIDRAMAQNPGDRWRDAGVMLHALRRESGGG